MVDVINYKLFRNHIFDLKADKLKINKKVTELLHGIFEKIILILRCFEI